MLLTCQADGTSLALSFLTDLQFIPSTLAKVMLFIELTKCKGGKNILKTNF